VVQPLSDLAQEFSDHIAQAAGKTGPPGKADQRTGYFHAGISLARCLNYRTRSEIKSSHIDGL